MHPGTRSARINLKVLDIDKVGGKARSVNGRLVLNRQDWAGAGFLV
jgi:hypothetical protein